MSLPRLHEELTTEVAANVRSGTSVVLTGLPGSGRTSMLRHTADLLDDAGYDVLRVRGARALRDRPLEALAVSDLAGDRPNRGASLLATYVTAVERLAAGGRFVLLVDDADDLDDESVGALVAAWGRRPFPLVATSRPHAAPGDGRGLTSSVDPVERVPVPALSYVETSRLVEGILGGPVGAATAGRVHAKSGGMPGLVGAVTRAARSAERLRKSPDGVWQAGGDLWTPALGEVVEHLLAGLDAAAMHALRVLALTGPVAPAIARRVVSWDVLEQLDGHGLLRMLGQGDQEVVGIYPPLVGEQFRHAGRDTVQLRVTEEIAAALGGDVPSLDGSAELLASAVRQARAAQDVCTAGGRESSTILNRYIADHVARQRLVRGAEWEQDRTPATAVRYLETILMQGVDGAAAVVARTPEQGDPTSIVLLRGMDAVRLAVGAADPGAAHRALARPLPPDVAAAEPGLVDVFDALDRRLTLLVERVPDDDPPASGTPDREPGLEVGREVSAVERVESLVAQGRALDALALLDAAPRAEDRWARPRDAARGVALVLAGRPHDALAWSTRKLDEAVADHDVEGVWAHGYARSFALAALGRYLDLRDHLGAVLSVGMIPLRQAHFAVGNLAIGAYAALRQGSVDAARTMVGQARDVGLVAGPWPLMSVGWFEGVAAASTTGGARAGAEAFWQESERLAARGYRVAAALMGVLSLESHPDAERARIVEGLLPAGQGDGLGDIAELARVVVTEDPAPAVDLYRRALDRGAALAAARALVHATRRLRATGDTAAADRLEAEARTARRLPGEMLAFLDRGDPVAGLTAREREIAGLVDAGLSNQQIARRLVITVSTVENHLNRVYRKLGVAGRDGLAAVLRAGAA